MAAAKAKKRAGLMQKKSLQHARASGDVKSGTPGSVRLITAGKIEVDVGEGRAIEGHALDHAGELLGRFQPVGLGGEERGVAHRLARRWVRHRFENECMRSP